MIVKPCSRNITGEVAAPVYGEKINLKVPDRLGIMFLLSDKMLFYRLSLNFCNSVVNHTTYYVLH